MTQDPASLAKALHRRIAATGPLAVADYMDACLADPEHGYYRTRDPLGARGDFITAPEISQIFGELIGLWCAEVWRGMGSLAPCALIELGPGRGTLIADALRAVKIVPEFTAAAELHLVETSPVLRAAQAERLSAHAPHWHDTLASVPTGPAIVIANEFLDALPVRQFVRREGEWRDRRVTGAPDGGFQFCEGEEAATDGALVPEDISNAASEGDIAEVRPAVPDLMSQLAARAAVAPLTALFIDYGHAASAPGDTFQAVAGHGFADPLQAPGMHDLTAHVDFAALARAARKAGLAVHGPVEQGPFLLGMGLAQRCERLMKEASGAQAREIESGARRVVDPSQMGALFKAVALTGATAPVPPSF